MLEEFSRDINVVFPTPLRNQGGITNFIILKMK